MLPTNVLSYYTSITWPVPPVLLDNIYSRTPSSKPPENLPPNVHYSTLSTVHSMVLIYVSTCLLRDKHPSWFGKTVSTYRNGLL